MGLTVAVDVGPLAGPRTGIGLGVEAMLDALRALPEPPQLLPYLVSYRATLPPGAARLPYPAALAHRAWARVDHPDAARRLRRPAVVHGTNYVVPPARGSARLVSVYDCWFLRHPAGVHPDVERAGRVLRRAVHHGAVVHASSQATADAVLDLLGPCRVEVVPLGPLPVAPAPAEAPPDLVARLGGRPFVLALGTVERRKNLHRLVDAFGRVEHLDPDVALVLGGADDNGSADVDAAVTRLPADRASRVHRLGRVSTEAKAWLLHNASVLAYPSLDEGFGFPLLEAMAVGVPIVASTAGSIPEVAGDAAMLVAPTDVDALASALSAALGDADVRRRLTAAAPAQLARFDWRTTAERLHALYASLAMESPPR